MEKEEYDIILKAYEEKDKKNYFEAIDLLNILIEKRNPKAIYELALIYHEINPHKYQNKIINLLVWSGELGYLNSYFELGLIFYQNRNFQEAYRFFKKSNNPKRFLYLGIMEFDNKIKNGNYKNAIYYFIRGSNKNVKECNYYLSICYHYGYGVKIDKVKEAFYHNKME